MKPKTKSNLIALQRLKVKLAAATAESERQKLRASRIDDERIQAVNQSASAQAHVFQLRRVLGCVLLSQPCGTVAYRVLDRLAETPKMRFKEYADHQIGMVWVDTTSGKPVLAEDGNAI